MSWSQEILMAKSSFSSFQFFPPPVSLLCRCLENIIGLFQFKHLADILSKLSLVVLYLYQHFMTILGRQFKSLLLHMQCIGCENTMGNLKLGQQLLEHGYFIGLFSNLYLSRDGFPAGIKPKLCTARWPPPASSLPSSTFPSTAI